MNQKSYEEVERGVSDRVGSYCGLCPEALLTKREDYEAIFSALPRIQKWVEPGSGHGLGPCLFAEFHPSAFAVGIEFEKARYDQSLRLKSNSNLANVEFVHADLLETELPEADAYFLYFPTGIVLDRILHQLKGQPLLIVIESHGDLIPRLQKEGGLIEVMRIPLKSSRHSPEAIVFHKTGPVSETLHSVSFQKRLLPIREDSGEVWLGESYGLEWSRNSDFNLLIPPRTISSEQVGTCVSYEEIQSLHQLALKLRRLGQLRIETNGLSHTGELRKIFVSPCFKVEISSGHQLEWTQIKKIFWENTLCYDSLSGYCFFPPAVQEW